MVHLFSYGTLQDPETQMEAIGRTIDKSMPAYTKGSVRSMAVGARTYNVLHPFKPGMPDRLVPGRLLNVSKEELDRLDLFEGVGAVYDRKLIDIFDSDGKPHKATQKAFAYVARPGRTNGSIPLCLF